VVPGGRRRPGTRIRKHLRRQPGLDLSRDRVFVATLLFLGASQGASYLFIRVGVRELSPPALMEIRLLFAAPLLVAYCVARGRGADLRAAWREGLVLGLLGAAIPWTLVGWGAQHVDAGVTAIANAAVPIFVAVIAAKALPGERVTGMRLAGVLLGLAGVALLAGAYPQGGWWGVAGTLSVVAAAPAYALGTLYAQRQSVGGLVIATSGLVWATVLLLPFAVPTHPGHVPSAKAFTAAVVLGVLCTAPAHALFYWMVSAHGASRSALVTYVTPVFALGLGALFLGEQATLPKLGGLLLIVTGVALGSGVGRSRRPAPLAQSA
jgi:drug/metabolite transporter (DMT)-like permease